MNNAVAIFTQPTSDQPKLPPMLTQYLEYKGRHQDSLLLFQVGDFYETFFDDAIKISKALNLTLTSRDKNSAQPIPMAGVPLGVVDNYVERLVDLGFSVALVSQSEAPANGKGMFSRKLDRIVTPGVRILSNSEGERKENILASIYVEPNGDGAIAFCNVQTGIVCVREQILLSNLGSEIGQIAPVELVLPRSGPLVKKIGHYPWANNISVKIRADTSMEVSAGREFANINGYGQLSAQSKRAVRLLLSYVDEATVDATVSISEIVVTKEEATLGIDASTRANLELVRNLKDGGTDGTLLCVLDYTKTPAGARALRQSILNPAVDLTVIKLRHQVVRFLKGETAVRDEIIQSLRFISDIERIAARIELKSATPRELGALKDSLNSVPMIRTVLEKSINKNEEKLLGQIADQLVAPSELVDCLNSALVEVPPLSSSDGGIVKDGYNEEVDRLRSLKQSGKSWIADLENKEKIASGISSLKIKYNNVIGFFFEITKSNLDRVPSHYIRRQSTVSGDRFTTLDLQKREEEVLGAQGKLEVIERKLFEELRLKALAFIPELRRLSRVVGELDTLVSLAEAAEKEDFVEPEIRDTLDLEIKLGRHPVVAKLLQGRFIPNSLKMLEDGKLALLITGPNMGGKSTFLRQAALIVIMAQMGGFVPAERAVIGVVDSIFARIGASDNMLEGESTFMVEMREASHIVSNATARSLLLIDELGRGTATADGLSIAQAILEWIVGQIKCRTLFATHFHELTALEKNFDTVGNLSVGSADVDGEVVFTHEILPGPASKSYGLEVARIAGLPLNLIDRAREVLAAYSDKSLRKGESASKQLSLLVSGTNGESSPKRVAEPADYRELLAIKKRLLNLNIDDMTPRAAMSELGEVCDLLKRD